MQLAVSIARESLSAHLSDRGPSYVIIVVNCTRIIIIPAFPLSAYGRNPISRAPIKRTSGTLDCPNNVEPNARQSSVSIFRKARNIVRFSAVLLALKNAYVTYILKRPFVLLLF